MANVDDSAIPIKEFRHGEDDGSKTRFRVWRKDGAGVEAGDSISLDDIDGVKGTTRVVYDSTAGTINTYVGDTLTQQVSSSGLRDVTFGRFELLSTVTSGHFLKFNGTAWVNSTA